MFAQIAMHTQTQTNEQKETNGFNDWQTRIHKLSYLFRLAHIALDVKISKLTTQTVDSSKIFNIVLEFWKKKITRKNHSQK